MAKQAQRRIVIASVALMLPLLAANAVMIVLTWSTPVSGDVTARTTVLTNLLAGLAMASVGSLLAYRRPENSIGWLFLAAGVYGIFGAFIERYTIYGLFTSPGSLPGCRLIASLTQAAWMPLVVVYSLLFLLFPSGRFGSPRWRLIARTIILCAVAAGLMVTLQPKQLDPPFEAFDNQVGIALFDGILPLALLFLGVMFALTLLAALALISRFLRSRGEERKQFQWFAYAGAMLPVALLLHSLADSFAPQLVDSVEALASLTATLLPIAVGIAILRYRLYDIDRIINRTLVYGSLTTITAVAYAGLIVALQSALSSVSGGSDLAIVVTTLVVAALFLPVRRRLQTTVDRRFNRRVYDAARTVDAFGARLRQQIDLDTLRYELLAVVDETMAPVRASVWLRVTESAR